MPSGDIHNAQHVLTLSKVVSNRLFHAMTHCKLGFGVFAAAALFLGVAVDGAIANPTQPNTTNSGHSIANRQSVQNAFPELAGNTTRPQNSELLGVNCLNASASSAQAFIPLDCQPISLGGPDLARQQPFSPRLRLDPPPAKASDLRIRRPIQDFTRPDQPTADTSVLLGTPGELQLLF